MDKKRRQQAILDLLDRETISSQERLRQKLNDVGFAVTQATLSRDLRELNIVKTAAEDGGYKYTILNHWGGLPIRSCEASGNLLVLRTEPGMAPALAYRVDALGLAAILGTVAGEDTLLVVISEQYDAWKVKRELWNKIQAE